MADGGILAGTGLPQAGKAAHRAGAGRPAGYAIQIEKPQFRQVLPFEIGMSRDGCQGVGSGISELGGIRFRANAKAI